MYIPWCFYRTNFHKITTDDDCIFQVACINVMNEYTHALYLFRMLTHVCSTIRRM